MKWFAGAIAVLVAVYLAVTLWPRDRDEPASRTERLEVAVPIEQAGHTAPGLVEVWRSDEPGSLPVLRAWSTGNAAPAWSLTLPYDMDWRREHAHRPPMLRAADVLIVPSRDGAGPSALLGLELATGTVRWIAPLLHRGWQLEVIGAHAGVVVAVAEVEEGERLAVAISAADGAKIWTTPVTGAAPRIAFHDDFVVIATTKGVFAMDATRDRRHPLSSALGDIVIAGRAVHFVTTTIARVTRRDDTVVLDVVPDVQFPADAQPEVLAACGGVIVRVANKGRGLIARPYAGKGGGWQTSVDKPYDILHAGASVSRWPVLDSRWPEPRYLALWADMGYRPKRGRLATIDCTSGTLRWLSGAPSPDVVTRPALVAGRYYIGIAARGGGEHAPDGFRYPPNPIAVLDGTTGRLEAAAALATAEPQPVALGAVVPWRVVNGFVHMDAETTAPWSVNPRTCELGPSRVSRTCKPVLPYVHKLLGRRPPTADN